MSSILPDGKIVHRPLTKKERLHARRLATGRLRHKKSLAKIRKAGYDSVVLWIPKQIKANIDHRAKVIGSSQRTFLAAAVEVGLRFITTSDVQRCEQTWRTIVDVKPHERWDRLMGPWHQWNRRRLAEKKAKRISAGVG